MTDSVLTLGEILWDDLPSGLFLGGAPYNVAYHLHQLGVPVRLGSRVGNDDLGRDAMRRLAADGMDTALVQTDPVLPTGLVRVALDARGEPQYRIGQPAAWDALALEDGLREAAASARAVVFGSLAQRAETSRATLLALAEAAPFSVFDVNLRPPHLDPGAVRGALWLADAVKLNADELTTVAGWLGWPEPDSRGLERTAEALARDAGCRWVCITRGAHGAVLWRDGRWTEHPGYAVPVQDAVGAGDAFLAGLLAALLDGQDDGPALDAACRLGAFVASRAGATPAHDADTIGALTRRSGPERY